MSIHSFEAAKLAKVPHINGVAVCCACTHEWAASAPVGTIFLRCPACHTNKARFVNPVLLEPGVARLECQCGCQLFSVQYGETDKLVCINCGTESDR